MLILCLHIYNYFWWLSKVLHYLVMYLHSFTQSLTERYLGTYTFLLQTVQHCIQNTSVIPDLGMLFFKTPPNLEWKLQFSQVCSLPSSLPSLRYTLGCQSCEHRWGQILKVSVLDLQWLLLTQSFLPSILPTLSLFFAYPAKTTSATVALFSHVSVCFHILFFFF